MQAEYENTIATPLVFWCNRVEDLPIVFIKIPLYELGYSDAEGNLTPRSFTYKDFINKNHLLIYDINQKKVIEFVSELSADWHKMLEIYTTLL